jgi:2-isopropylmalate synthase
VAPLAHCRKGEESTTNASGVGPVNALDQALRGALGRFYPHLEGIRLVDYKVRVLASGHGTESVVRVHIEFASDTRIWSTVGVSPNIIQASYAALVDGIEYHLTSMAEMGQKKSVKA